eukprot:COSAG06_NODE_2430_length_6872_cov_6.208953_12_plen_49_part_00
MWTRTECCAHGATLAAEEQLAELADPLTEFLSVGKAEAVSARGRGCAQ